jgi:hypothetical protein
MDGEVGEIVMVTLQGSVKVLLIAAVMGCSAGGAIAQEVENEVTGTVGSVHGGFGDSSDLGQSVTVDFSYDSSLMIQQVTPTGFTLSWPITSANLASSPFGSGINLEWNGPGSGTLTDDFNLIAQNVTVTALTGIDPPSSQFTGDVYGFSLVANSGGNTLDLIRDSYNQGTLDLKNSGDVTLSGVTIGPASAPEIDPNSALSALTLLAGGIAVLGRRKLVKA